MDDDTVSSTPSSRAPPTPLRRSKSRLTPQPRGRASPAPSMGHNENSPPQGKADQTALLEYAAKINEAGTSPATQSKLAATMGSPPKGRGSLLAVSPRPSVVNTPLPPTTDLHDDAAPMSREALCWTLKQLGGHTIPAAQVAEMTTCVHAIWSDGPAPPATMGQRRTYIEDWAACNKEEIAAARPPPSPPPRPPKPPPQPIQTMMPPPTPQDENDVAIHQQRQEQMRAMRNNRQQHMTPSAADAPPDAPPAAALASMARSPPREPPPPANAPSAQSAGPGATLSLLQEVRRTWSVGATEQGLHALASAIAVHAGFPLPNGGAAAQAAFVIDFHNYARHAMRPVPPPITRPGEKPGEATAAATANAPTNNNNNNNNSNNSQHLEQQQAELTRQLVEMQQRMKEQLEQQQAQHSRQMTQMAQTLQAQMGQAQQQAAEAQQQAQEAREQAQQQQAIAQQQAMRQQAMQQQQQQQQQSLEMQRRQQLQMERQQRMHEQDASPPSNPTGYSEPPPSMPMQAMAPFGSVMPTGGGGMADGGGGMVDDPNMPLATPRDSGDLLNRLESALGGDVDGQLPLTMLNDMARHVSIVSKKKAPRLAVQKRQFVKNWYEDQRKLAGLGGKDGGPGGTPGLTAEAVYNEVDRRIQQAKRSLTAMGELPEVHIDALSEKIANLLGQKVPTMKRERRNLVEGWHAHIKRQVSARGR